MNAVDPLLPSTVEKEVAALIATLHSTEQRLEELTAGEVDTVAGDDGRTFLLRQAQDQMRQREAAKQAAILEAVPADIALLDAQGVIVSVNASWHRFAEAGALDGLDYRVGVNYLDVCDQVCSNLSADAHRVAEGIRSVLNGKANNISIEYSRHSPTQQRFQMTVTSLAGDKLSGAVVMRLDVTAQGLAQEQLLESETRFRQMAENIHDVFFLLDARTGHLVYISPAYAEIWGRSSESLYAQPESWIDAIHPDDQAAARKKYADGMAVGSFELDYRIIRPDGSVRWIEDRGFPVRDDDGVIVRVTGIAKDVSEGKLAGLALQKSEAEFRSLAESMPQIVWITRADGWCIYFNQQWTDYTGLTTEQSMGHGWNTPFHPDERQAAWDAWENATKHNGTYSIESRIRRADGTYRWWLMRGVPQLDDSGNILKWFGTCTDIHDLKMAELGMKRLNRVHALLSEINALIVRVRDRDELFREACRIAVESGGFRMAMIAVVDQATSKIVPIATAGKADGFLQTIREVLGSDEKAPTTMCAKAIREKTAVVTNDSEFDPRALLREDYTKAGVRSFAVLPLIIANEAVGIIALYAAEKNFFHEEEMRLLTKLADDVAFAIDHIDKQARLDYLAYYDPLTGLANQALFLERVQAKLSSAIERNILAVFVIDIQRFRNINSVYGRQAGDPLLQQVAERLLRVGGGDASRFARIGPDQFAVVSADVENAEQAGRRAEERLKAMFDPPFLLGEQALRVSVKAGIALFPDDGADAETLLRHAEAAVKKAKGTGEQFLFFAQAMTERVAERLSLEHRLRQALDNEEFVLHYQPKVDLRTGRLTSAEALIRWHDPRTGLVPPGMFIPILEDTGLIYEVGRWALHKSLTEFLRWRDAGLSAVRIAVNVSALQLDHPGFIGQIERVLATDANGAEGLELEITESMIMGDIKRSIATLQAIRDMGLTIAIDDFGTGFSSLGYLSKLPVDTLKIDRSFVVAMTESPEGMSLVSTIVNLAHSLHLKVVAEGVETEEQSHLLRLLRCDEMQGYLFSKPVPADVFEAKFLALPASAPAAVGCD